SVPNDGGPFAALRESFHKRLLPVGGDLDGDGVPDLLATGPLNHLTMSEPFSPLVALSGKTGRRLWVADLQVGMLNGPKLVACHDLDGDGRPEVLFVAATDWGLDRPPGPGRSTDDLQYWLAVLSGADGRLLWKQPLSGR